ncbi:hypothetical protein DY000_02053920 [Brassica cretica]|uniref:Reverse transcriptase zinc-binding domain-containing protein n=1 Tax=Brassica cretica TaxID=69181 RepID=A0ABQ7ADN6_BRACR|nr:hypothetical protein DY000_02053920 [Brassica cretica]
MHLTLLGFKSAPPFRLLVPRPFCSSRLKLCFPVTARGEVAPSQCRLSFRLVLGVRSNLLSSLQVTIGSVWLLSLCPLFAAGTGDGNSLLHWWCGPYPGMNSALHLWFAHWGGFKFLVFGVWLAKAGESFVCKGYQLLLAPLSIVGDWSSFRFKNAIPRHALTLWTVNLNRLPVRERLVNWRMAYNATVEARPGHFGYRFGSVRVFRVSGNSGRGLEDPFTT